MTASKLLLPPPSSLVSSFVAFFCMALCTKRLQLDAQALAQLLLAGICCIKIEGEASGGGLPRLRGFVVVAVVAAAGVCLVVTVDKRFALLLPLLCVLLLHIECGLCCFWVELGTLVGL